MKVDIIGAGLAGSEAAWQIAERGIKVDLYEMRPINNTPAHKGENFAELVCSNSFRANNIENAVGLLKEEMRKLNSLIMDCADRNSIPAGGALAVDRERFSSDVTNKIANHPLIEIHRKEITSLELKPDEDIVTLIASGPLTSDSLSQEIANLTGEEYFYFFDAAAPIVTLESINMHTAFWASRYDKGDKDYLNCPMTEEQYNKFYDFLITAQKSEKNSFEKEVFFEGCMPIEEMARRGKQTLLFGPMKPVGITNPYSDEKPFAIVQLRKDNLEGTLFNLVGFQTSLKWDEQKHLIRLIPGLENAEIVRYGVMHKNTYINSPKLLLPTMQFKNNKNIFFAGQMTGVEGYIESAASGLAAGINISKFIQGKDEAVFPEETALGALLNYITIDNEKNNFQPMNINFGLLPSLGKKIRDKKLKNSLIAKRSLEVLTNFIEKNEVL